MITLATVKVSDVPDGTHDIYVDQDDNGWVHLKQGDEWVSLPAGLTDRLIAALQNVWRE